MSVFFYGCISLDGYLAGRNHELDWLYQSGSPEETGYDEFYRRMDVTVMGRRTFREIEKMELPQEAYPSTENYVFTHEPLSQPGFIAVDGDVPDFVRQFPEGKNIWIVGGNTILAPLLDRGMVDEMIIQVAPVLLGAGIPLFTQGEALARFRLAGVRQYGQFAELAYEKITQEQK